MKYANRIYEVEIKTEMFWLKKHSIKRVDLREGQE